MLIQKVDQISNYLDSEADKLASAVEGIGDAVASIVSDDPVEIVTGTIDMVSAVVPLIPVGGPIIGTAFSLIGAIFGAIAGAGQEDVGSVVEREMKKALNAYEDAELRDEVEGTRRVYDASHAYLAAAEGDPEIMPHEIAALAANVPVYSGVEFLGKLSNKIEQYSTTTEPEQAQRAIEYLQLYSILAVLRTSVLWQMYGLIKASGTSDFTAAAIKRVIESEDDNDKDFLERLIVNPTYSKAIFMAYFNPFNLPQTYNFYKKKGVAYQRHDYLNGKRYSFRPDRWRNWYMYMSSSSAAYLLGTRTLDDQGRFIFEVKNYVNNQYYIKSAKWPDWYIYMEDQTGKVRGIQGKPTDMHEAQWKVIQFHPDGTYLLATRKWPNKFIYMDSSLDGWIKWWTGDPGIQGHWHIP